jgi:Zn-dependent metalloprotease
MYHRHRCSIYCVLPPYILERVAQHGAPEQQHWAQRSLLISERIRGQRDAVATYVGMSPTPAGEKRRTVYDASRASELPGRLVRGEGDPPCGDVCADEAYDGAGATFDLFHDIYGRNSLDDRGLRLDSSIHYGEGFDNAFWNGSQMVYGDGDTNLPPAQQLFNRFTSSVDIIGHELTHGVTQYEANLLYFHQPGALNEAISDIFGTLVKQRAMNQTVDQADWLIGGALFTSNVNAQGIRSLKAPGTAYDDPVLGKDPQPAHMEQYVKVPLWTDNGGVHINSGIPNHAFYVTAMEIGGHAWEHAGRIWYYTLRDRLRRISNFFDVAHKTHEVAGDLYGEGSREQKAVQTGWDAVGIDCTKFSLAMLDIR